MIVHNKLVMNESELLMETNYTAIYVFSFLIDVCLTSAQVLDSSLDLR